MALSDRIRALAGRAGAALQSYSMPPTMPGIGRPTGIVSGAKLDPEAERIARSSDALFAAIARRSGPVQTRYSTYPGTGLTPQLLAAIFQQADQGVMLQKADLDEQVYQRDLHLQAVDSSVRDAIVSKKFRVRAANASPLAIDLAKYMQAVVDQIDRFDRACYGLLWAHGAGYACAENIYARGAIRVPLRGGGLETIRGIFPRTLETVHNKHFRFNLETDETYLDTGGQGWIPLVPNKFTFHSVNPNWFIEKSGYMRAAHPLCMLKSHATRDWAVWIALFALPNILGVYPKDTYEQAEAKATYDTILQDFGQGKPALVPDDLDVKVTPAPGGGRANDPPAAMIGWINTELSKLIQGETLTTELGGVGGYNTSETHADVKHDKVLWLSNGLNQTLRSDLFMSVLRLNAADLMRRYGATEEDLYANCPLATRRIERELSPVQRMNVLDIARNKLGFPVTVAQVSEEMAIDVPGDGDDVLDGAPITVASGGMAVSTADASEGVDNPKPETPTPPPPKPAMNRKRKK